MTGVPPPRRSSGSRANVTDTRRAATRWPLLIISIAVLLLVVAGMVWLKQPQPRVEPPEIDLSTASPPVARTIRQARERVVSQPRNAETWGRLGMVLMAHQYDAEVDTCLLQAAHLASKEFRWPYLLGLHLSVSRLDEAIRHWERAANLDPNNVVVRLRLGEALLQQGRVDQAETCLTAATRIAPNSPRAALDRTRLALALGDVSRGIEWAETAARLAPDCGEVHRLLAQVYQRAARHAAATVELDRAERSPNELGWDDPLAAEVLALRVDTPAIIQTAEALLSQKQFAQAIAILEDTLAEDDREPQLFAVLGRALVQAGQLPRAAELMQRAVERHPESAEVWFQFGVAQFACRQFVDAETSFRMALRKKPDFALAHFNLGHTRERQGDLDGALAAFQATLRFRPTYAAAHMHLGRLLLQRGQRDLALEHLHRADELEPGNALAKRLLKEAETP